MSGTTVLINCFEVFSPAQDQEEKVLCDFCVIKKTRNKPKHPNARGQYILEYFFILGDVTCNFQPKIPALSLPMLFASREWLVLLLETYLQS